MRPLIATPNELAELEAGPQNFGDLERAPVLAAGDDRQLRGEHIERIGDRQRHHGEEDRLHAQREQPDRRARAAPRATSPAAAPSTIDAPAWPEPIEREPDAIGADAEEHHMRERDDAGIAEQHDRRTPRAAP